MNETEVDGEEYLSCFYSLRFIYTFLYEWCQSCLTWCSLSYTKDACDPNGRKTADKLLKVREDKLSCLFLEASNWAHIQGRARFFKLGLCGPFQADSWESLLLKLCVNFLSLWIGTRAPEVRRIFHWDEEEDSSCFKVGGQRSFGIVLHADRTNKIFHHKTVSHS